MASVEQREASLPPSLTTMELFDKYKVLGEEKDSDEESFHIPLLEAEEEAISNSKESGDNKTHTTESEDDILNKFDCSTSTPDPVDPKVEDSILDDDNEEENVSCNLVSKKDDELVKNGLDTLEDNIDKKTENDDVIQESVKVNSGDSGATKIDNEEIIRDADERDERKENDTLKKSDKTDGIINDIQDEIFKGKEDETDNVDKDKVGNDKDAVLENDETMEVDEVENCGNSVKNICDSESISTNGKSVENEDVEIKETEVITKQIENTDVPNKQEISVLNDSAATEVANEEMSIVEKDRDEEAHEKEGVDMEKNIEEIENDIGKDDKKANDNGKDLEHTHSNVESSLANQTENSENENVNNMQMQPTESLGSVQNEKEVENTTKSKDSIPAEVSDKDMPESGQTINETSITESEAGKTKEDDVSNSDEAETKSTKADVNDSGNSENLEQDDLLDISVICDVDEDNAKAVAENAIDRQNSDKSDNDEPDDKAENDVEESEADQEDNACSSDKDDGMEFEDCPSSSNSNSQFEVNSSTQENVVISNASEKNTDSNEGSDSAKEDVEMVDVLPKVIAGLVKQSDKPIDKPETEEKTDSLIDTSVDSPQEPVQYLDLDQHMAEQKKASQPAVVQQPSGKRSLPPDENGDNVATKKIRLSDSPKKGNNKKPTALDEKTKALMTFQSFMRSKFFSKKLTRSDLEQFCLQKICEVLMHKTQLGDLHQMVRKQEQIIETLRKDVQQVTKQARDLDIVNKKLINELKGQNGKQKPLVPLKITRSVGLQVKLTLNSDATRKRAPITPSRPSSTNTPNSTTPANNRQRTITPNNNVVRQVNATSPRKPQTTPNAQTPLLSQALQTSANRQATPNTNTAKRPSVPRSKTTEPTKPANPGVIDLTDEDDKAGKPAGTGTTVKILNKQIMTPKLVAAKQPGKALNVQNKVVGINHVKPGQIVNKGTPTRAVTALPQGVRLTPTGTVKNGIAIPANVVTSSTGGAQLMYVVQPTSSLVTTTAQGGQKTVLLNFQPGNGILTSALNGSAVSVIPTKTNVQVKPPTATRKHPAPLPLPPPLQTNTNLKPLLPKPHLSIRKTDTGIILQWRMPYNLELYECIASYQLFAYQETNAPPSTDMWRKVGDVKALALPMACTLTQFADKNKYYFAVRSVDVHKRIGAFSDPEEISL